jgi:hypothetical protein
LNMESSSSSADQSKLSIATFNVHSWLDRSWQQNNELKLMYKIKEHNFDAVKRL